MKFLLARARRSPALVVALAMTIQLAPLSSTRLEAAELPVGATLNIIAPPVEVAPAGSDGFGPAADGQIIQPGDVVRTGDGGMALLTFFDGSESQLSTNSQVQVEHAEYTPAPNIALLQSSGVTLNRVIPLPPGGNFETDTPSAIGLVRGTSYLVNVAQPPSDGSTPVTSIVLVTDRDGHVGHVQLVAAASSAVVELSRAGDAGATAGQSAAAAQVSDQARADMEMAMTDLTNPDTASDAAAHVRATAHALAAVVTNSDGGSSPDSQGNSPGSQSSDSSQGKANSAVATNPAGNSREVGTSSPAGDGNAHPAQSAPPTTSKPGDDHNASPTTPSASKPGDHKASPTHNG